ncbi:methyl-accepting chemotaxis protein [Paraburkholderia atlantica]|uniref:methyl-accepting chemotaxis protein n=1 Tax=Paraburkholderia atlantica TaxID=2654982 RepID=UPI001622E674|nr:methyl-accepting chemotaxis protein [Paraburkholderia atlantica]MBB5504701.1 methyl-accepting chemotaxis protein [Paraburkholderia atlantica]
MERFRLKVRLWLALAVMCMGILAIGLWGAYKTRDTMIADREDELKNVVSIAYSVLDRYNALATAGTMPLADAQRAAMDDLRAMRYDGAGGYLVLEDSRAHVLMHATRADLVGKDMSTVTDPDGRHVFKEGSEQTQREGEAFVHLMFPKPGTNQLAPKSNYMRLYKPWDWTIVTGVFTDDIEAVFYRTLAQYVIAALVLCALVSLVIGVIVRSILRQLGGEPAYAVQIASRIADGDLDVIVDTKTGDSTSLLAAMKRMQQRLAQAIEQIRSGATLISSVSNEIAAGNSDLSRRTEQQAAALGETASSMEQITATVRQNADNAKQASQLAHNASETAARGGAVVGQVIDTMRGISQSSHRIGDIIGVIEGIAFQTNILALNAAVEAARAGEEGRGFAVVAGEVRTLAQRSAAAAKEIKALIEESAAQIAGGSEHVGRAGDTMQEVVQAVRRVNDIMGEISAASVEQTSGIEQVNIAVASMDQTTQQNAALVEEASASADVLKTQTGQLSAAIAVFKLPEQR